MDASAPPPPANSGFLGAISGALDSASKAVGLKKENTTPPGVAPEGAGYTGTGGRRRKTRKGKRSTRKTLRRLRKGKKGGRKH
jgi:hypothetical protein